MRYHDKHAAERQRARADIQKYPLERRPPSESILLAAGYKPADIAFLRLLAGAPVAEISASEAAAAAAAAWHARLPSTRDELRKLGGL
jgi:hypothetical protein